ncbi:MAG: hypothetical protein Q9N34_01760 [Aquificota bacterium]|nr:hypothetical protein [Aquificota bacterium]
MKRLLLFLVGTSVIACAPVSEKSDRVAEVEIKLTRLEEKQKSLKEDIDRTNERIDRLTEILSELRLELERIKLKLFTEVSEPKGTPKEGSEVVRLEPENVRVPPEEHAGAHAGKIRG